MNATVAPLEGPDAAGLAALEARLAEDLERLCHPPANWVPPAAGPDGARAADVVVVGGGMCGLTAAFALLRNGIRNVRILDRAPAGEEGPWVTYARMETLRSPKQLTGPAMGMASLTFRAWYEAQYGEAAWQRLDRIPRPMWMDYLRWYRRALDLPVENGVAVTAIRGEASGLLALDVEGAEKPRLHARKVILATGREGLGAPSVPAFMDDVPRDRWAHSSDDIDFPRLRGARVGVVGAGASAVENAAAAAEAGAAAVHLFVRRSDMPRINKLMGIGSPGFTHGFPELPEAWRWTIMYYSFTTQTPAPRGSTLRLSRHPTAHFRFGHAIERVEPVGDGLRVHTSKGPYELDYLILGTGFSVEPTAREELGEAAREIACWEDRFTPPAGWEHRELGRFPYLAPDFAFTERTPGRAPWLTNVHCFNYAASLSLGKVSGDIPAVSVGAGWLADRLAATFYVRDIDVHWEQLLAYDKPELTGDEWTPAE
jgi:hypothetical protein